MVEELVEDNYFILKYILHFLTEVGKADHDDSYKQEWSDGNGRAFKTNSGTDNTVWATKKPI